MRLRHGHGQPHGELEVPADESTPADDPAFADAGEIDFELLAEILAQDASSTDLGCFARVEEFALSNDLQWTFFNGNEVWYWVALDDYGPTGWPMHPSSTGRGAPDGVGRASPGAGQRRPTRYSNSAVCGLAE